MHAGNPPIPPAAAVFGPFDAWSLGQLLPFLIIGGAAILLIVKWVATPDRSERDPYPAGKGAPTKPAVPTDELERRAGIALVAADERVTAAEAEVDYASARDGDEVAAALGQAVARARGRLADAFAVQRDAATAGDEASRRRAAASIPKLTAEVDGALDRAHDALGRLRELGTRVAAEQAALGEELAALDVAAAGTGVRIDEARGRYTAESLTTAAQAHDAARAALTRARPRLAAVAEATSGPAARAGVRIEAMRADLREGRTALAAVDGQLAALAAGDASVADAITALEHDLETARAAGSSRLDAVVAQLAGEALALRAELAAPNRDPAALGRRAARADAAIDAAVRGVADSAKAQQRAEAERSSALAGARMLVRTATNTIGTMPDDPAARIRREEASALLDEARIALARASEAGIPAGDARDHADAATHLARRAMAISRNDVASTPRDDGRMFDLAAGGDGPVSEFLAGLLDGASTAIDELPDSPEGRYDGRIGPTWTWKTDAP